MSGASTIIKHMPTVLAVACGSLAVAVICVQTARLVSALRTPAADSTKMAGREALTKQIQNYSADLDSFAKQIDGRSLFFVPSAPTPPPPPPPPVKEAEPPPPPPKPSSYGGPAILGMVNDQVWFVGDKKLGAGERSEPDELKVIRLESPWAVVVEWKGVEFTVPLFERDKIVFPPAEPKKPEPKSDEPKTDEKKEEPKPAEPKKDEPKTDDPKPAEPSPTPEPPKPESEKPPSEKPS